MVYLPYSPFTIRLIPFFIKTTFQLRRNPTRKFLNLIYVNSSVS